MTYNVFRNQKIGTFFLILWIPTVTLILSLQMAKHLARFEPPKNTLKVQNMLAGLGLYSATWVVGHFIYGPCSCANSLIGQLAQNRIKQHERRVFEHVVLVNPNEKHRILIKNANYSFQVMSKQSYLTQLSLDIAPILAIARQNKLVYFGGYYPSSQNWNAVHHDIFSKIVAGIGVEALPIFGCGVSDKLRRLFDPIGIEKLKYF